MENHFYDLTIKNALVVTADPSNRVIPNGLIAIKNGIIELVEDNNSPICKKITSKKEISGSGRMVMPGLINMHCHAGDSLFRGLVENLSLEEWLDKVWVAEKAILDKSTTYLGSILGLAENLLCGATTVMDMFWYPSETVRAARDLGLRIATGGIFFDPPGVGHRSHPDYLKEAEEFLRLHSRSDEIFPVNMPHGAYTVSPNHLRDAKKLSDQYGGLFCTHAAETLAEQKDIQRRYGLSVIRHLAKLDVLGPKSILAHCVHLDDKEMDLISETETVVVHNPLSNLKLGSGIAPIHKMLKNGIRLTLGTDGAISGNDLDMWLAMRLAATLPKGQEMKADLISPTETLHMATLNGANALGLGKELGSLEIGKKADFLILKTNVVNATPMFDPITHIIYSANKSDVQDVFVGGKQVVRNGNLELFDIYPILEKIQSMVPNMRSFLEKSADEK